MKTFALFIGMAFLVLSCSTPSSTTHKSKVGEQNQSTAIKPIPGLEIPIRTFEVSATEASTISLPNGGSIRIPENAFVDEGGKKITGKVEISWQEYHSIIDILFSGIPMAYDSAGVETVLQSGGMFTIHGSQNNQRVEIAPSKTVEVSLASNNSQEQFNFYSLNEKSGEWKYETTALATPNPRLNTDDKTENTDNSKYYTLNLYASFKRDSFPELKQDEIIAWEVLKSEISPKQLARYNRNNSEARIIGKTNNQYQLELKDKDGSLVLNAHPVTFEAKGFSHEQAKKTIQESEAAMVEFQNLSKQGRLIRTMDIPNFGTYNWDCMYNRDHEQIYVDMTVPGEKMSELAAFFFVVPEDGVVVPISNSGKLKIPKNEACGVVAISTNNTVHSLPYTQIKSMLGKKGKINKINLSPSKGTLERPSDMAAFINQCV
jgi:hypothetical protein